MGQLEAWLWGSSVCSCLPSLTVSEMPPPQVAVSSSCLFFPASFQDLFCLSLPAVSLVWNIFSSLYPIGFKLPVSSPDFRARAQHIPGCSLLCFASLQRVYLSLFCLIFSIFSYSSYPWVYLGILGFLFHYFFCHCCMFGAENVHQAWILSHSFFSAQPSLYVQRLLNKGSFMSVDPVVYLGMCWLPFTT